MPPVSARPLSPDHATALAIEAARSAGSLLAARFGGPATGVDAKSSRTDLVSDADRDAEAIILETLTAARPHDAIIAEESGSIDRPGAQVRWHVDPLDGTVNYLWGIPHWAVSIHASDAAGDLTGVIFDPCRDELFVATPDGVARNGTPCTLEPADDLSTALVATGFSYDASVRQRQAQIMADLAGSVRDIRRYGSAALDLAWVAAGRYDLYFERALNIWDVAAGSMMVRQAGGVTAALEATAGLPSGLVAGRRGLVERVMPLVDRA